MTDQPDRRKFLTQAGATIGSFLASPRLGIMAALGGFLATADSNTASAKQGEKASQRRKTLQLRSGDPINAQGEPFGGTITGFVLSAKPAAQADSRVLLTIGHEGRGLDGKLAGVSVLEFAKSAEGQWRHEISSHLNRRWHQATPTPLEGARLNSADGKMHRLQRLESGVGEINQVSLLPWNTVLCTERDGWVVEVNPLTGVAIKRASLGKVGAVAALVLESAGNPLVVYLLGTRLFKFVSHQRFDARLMQANSQLLQIGELYVADFQDSSWRPLTEKLGAAEWERNIEQPDSACEMPERLAGERLELAWADGSRRALVVSSGSQRLVIEDLGRAFSFKVDETSRDSESVVARGRVLSAGAFISEPASDLPSGQVSGSRLSTL